MSELIYADDINYWKTSRSGVETWMERIEKQIEDAGGEMITDAFVSDSATLRAAFMVVFRIGEDQFKIMWPVLQPSKSGRAEQKAAKVQAITALYHDIKNSCVKAKFVGSRHAFFDYYVLPDGRTTTEASLPELSAGIPSLLKSLGQPQIEEQSEDKEPEGEIIDI